MKKIEQEQIDRLQTNLSILRSIAGWKADELGEMLGLTKQSVSNIEHGKTKLTKAQYIAIRALIDEQIKTDTENQTLSYIAHLLLDTEELTEEELKAANDINKAIQNAKLSSTNAKMKGLATAGAALGAVSVWISSGIVIAASGGSNWLKELITSAKKK